MQGDPSTSTDSVSRRTVLKRGALTATAVGLGGAAVGGAAGQDESPQSMRALMYLDQVYPLSRFQVVSPSLEWTPEFENLPEGVQTPVGENYDTRIAKYRNTDERVLFFPRSDAEIDRSVTYGLTNIRGFKTGDPEETLGRIVQVRFSPAEDVVWPDEGNATATTEGNRTTAAGNETTSPDGDGTTTTESG